MFWLATSRSYGHAHMRPRKTKAFAQLISSFSGRHNVKPGIVCWAQVNGCRGDTDTLEKMQRRVEHDLHCIDNWSFLFDLRITLLTLFSKDVYVNAY
jgi:lipopolysaccharide/colanic/teichoic acid biosynthesis glycosyltransferase